MTIDVRSDTVTRPTPAMLEAMMAAPVGDDVYGEDETVNALQTLAAETFGMDAALFCPSGTMTNQIAIKLHTQPGDEVICDALSHTYLYEGGGIAFHSGASVRTLPDTHGRFTAKHVKDNVNNRNDAHLPWTRLVTVENTVNKAGGCCWELSELKAIRQTCDEHSLGLHLDGARLYNAIVAKNHKPSEFGTLFHTISLCLSKGLGAPVGSLLLGSREHIARAHRLRKLMGGGMRQAGYLAAAGLYGLQHHVTRLADDHAKARHVASEIASLPYVASVLPVETNIVIFNLIDTVPVDGYLRYLSDNGVRAGSMGKQTVRFVFHLDVSDAQTSQLIEVARRFA